MLYCVSSQILREFLVPRKKIPQSTHYLLLYPTHLPEQLLKCCHESTSQKSSFWVFFWVVWKRNFRSTIGILWCPYWLTGMFESFFLTGEVHPPWLRNRGKLIPRNLGSFSGMKSPSTLDIKTFARYVSHLKVWWNWWNLSYWSPKTAIFKHAVGVDISCWKERQAWWLTSWEGKDPKK